MKAVRMYDYGVTVKVQVDDVPVPQPGDEELLIRVHAAGVNPIDNGMRAGIVKAFFGFDPSLPYTLGWEVSGVVEAVGKSVREFRVHDEVYAVPNLAGGGYADYVTVSQRVVAHKPQNVDHTHCAGVPVAGLAAWQALHDIGHVQAGQRVLVLAAAGGVGTFAVQMARLAGAEVWGTTSTRNLELVHKLGAEPIDYTARPFEDAIQNVDIVIDPLGGENQKRAWKTLKPNGTLVSVVGEPTDPSGQRRGGSTDVASSTRIAEHLIAIGRLLDQGDLHVVTDRVFPLHEAQAALELSASGHARGKIVLAVADSQ